MNVIYTSVDNPISINVNIPLSDIDTSVFSNETSKLINSCGKGDILIFKNIVAKGLDPDELKIPDLILFVD